MTLGYQPYRALADMHANIRKLFTASKAISDQCTAVEAQPLAAN